MTLFTCRQRTAQKLEHYLAEKQLYTERYFDCGTLGILHVYWIGFNCQSHWITITPNPLAKTIEEILEKEEHGI